MRVKLHPDARAELRYARNWYHERSPLSAFAFAQTVKMRSRESKTLQIPFHLSITAPQVRSSTVSPQHPLSNSRDRYRDRCSCPSEATARILVQSNALNEAQHAEAKIKNKSTNATLGTSARIEKNDVISLSQMKNGQTLESAVSH